MNRHLLYALIIAALSAPGPGPTALAKTSPPRGERYEDASDHVFLDGEITSVRVEMEEESLAFLLAPANASSREYKSCTVRIRNSAVDEVIRNVGIRLTDKDITRAKELLDYPWFQKKEWQMEIKAMLASGLKYELDALANKDFRYLTTHYLPRKLKERDWLD